MATPFVIQQLSKKLKLEAQVSPKLNRFFREISRSITPVLRVTGRVPTLDSFKDDLIDILTKHYKKVAKEFKGDVVTEVTKSASLDIETKQETIEDIADESQSVLNEALAATIAIRAPKQADFILATTEKELNQSVEKVSIEAAKNGERLTLAEQGKRAARDFNEKIPGRVETIAMFETQAMAEDTKITEAQVIALAGIVIKKKWNTILDERTRSSHALADGQRRPLALPFTVQGQSLMMPGDTLLGASLDNVLGCRCTTSFSL